MHVFSYRALSASLLFSFCLADQGFRLGKFANGLVGEFSEYAKQSSGQPSTALEPENEAIVQEVAKVMKIDKVKVRSHQPSFAMTGPHANGDVIYLTDQWFKEGKHAPFVQKFVIGHELVHVDEAHSFLRLSCLYGLTFGSAYLLKKLSDYTTLSEKTDHFVEQHFPHVPYRTMFGKAYLGFAGFILGMIATTKLMRAQEFEADWNALEKMGPVYGHDKVRQGAAEFFSSNPGFEPHLVRHVFSTHPHSGDRLRALGLKKEASQDAADLIQPLLEERVDLRIQCIACPEHDEEQKLLVTHRLAKNWQKILRAVRICSVHQDVAKNYCEQLNSVRYVELFSKKFQDIIAVQPSEEKNQQLYENAIESECNSIALGLQELA